MHNGVNDSGTGTGIVMGIHTASLSLKHLFSRCSNHDLLDSTVGRGRTRGSGSASAKKRSNRGGSFWAREWQEMKKNKAKAKQFEPAFNEEKQKNTSLESLLAEEKQRTSSLEASLADDHYGLLDLKGTLIYP